MTTNNKHINEETFRRYLENKMTPQERNVFERELQKDPFAQEALEGFEAVSSLSVQSDLSELKERITPKKRKYKSRYWAAAATILLLVTAGVIWMQLDNKHSVQEVAESKSVEMEEKVSIERMEEKETSPEREIIQPQPSEDINKKGTEKISPKSEVAKSIPLSPPVIELEKDLEVVDDDGIIDDFQTEMKQEIATPRSIDSNIGNSANATKRNYRTKSSTISFLAVEKENAIQDSFSELQADQDSSEIDTSSYNKVWPDKKIVDSIVQPEIGMEKFEEYLKKEAVLPEGFSRRKTVKLLLSINYEGKIEKIENTNRADSILFEKAKQIILNGSDWKPEIKNGIPVDSEVELKIIFRKK